MDWKKITTYFSIACVIGILGFDAVAWYKGGQEATISWLTINVWSRDFPAITFMVGFLCGHLFWPMSKNKRVVK